MILIGKFAVQNNKLLPLASNTDFDLRGCIYEVIRVNNGQAIFWQEHIARLQNSIAKIDKCNFAGCQPLNTAVQMLIANNTNIVANLLVACCENSYTLAYCQAVYPTAQQYKTGVNAVTINAMRSNPQVKLYNAPLRQQITKLLSETGAYEALLLSANGYFSEGSRSNLFFLKGKQLYTAPDSEVLQGITRSQLIQLCLNRGLTVNYQAVRGCDINQYDAVFITGTSPQVLAIRQVDNHKFDWHSSRLPEIIAAFGKQYHSL